MCNRYVPYCQLSISQFVQHNFFCTIVNPAHFLNTFPLIIFFHSLSYRLSFLHLTDDDLQSVLCLLIYICKVKIIFIIVSVEKLCQSMFQLVCEFLYFCFSVWLSTIDCLHFCMTKGRPKWTPLIKGKAANHLWSTA